MLALLAASLSAGCLGGGGSSQPSVALFHPTATINPEHPRPGQPLHVEGEGFPAHHRVYFQLNGALISHTAVETDGRGRFRATIPLPAAWTRPLHGFQNFGISTGLLGDGTDLVMLDELVTFASR